MSCLAALTMAIDPGRALACGGCFHGPPKPQTETTVVTGHRMAYSISPDRTVLWDQIKYQGAPGDFAWVLPVRPGATLELSRDAWFEALDTATQTKVTPPQLTCASSTNNGGCDCAAGSASPALAKSSGDAANVGGGGGVTVVHQEVVGPYETVTLQSTSGDALTTWLDQNGYVVPPDIAPTIGAYVSEGFDFIALRLSPGQGTQQMKPVRVVTPGPEGALPLRMVAAGIGDSVDILLFVIGEARYRLPDLNEVFVDDNAVSWDFAQNSSNYATLRAQALAQNLRYSYLTSFSDRGALAKTYTDPSGASTFYVSSAGGISYTIADLYFAQADIDAGTASNCQSVVGALGRADLISAPGSAFSCAGYDDIAAAMIGQHPQKVWLSRLELNLTKEALSVDCIVKPGPVQAPVSNQLLALAITNRPASCQQPVFESGTLGRTTATRGVWLGALAALALGRMRRRVKAS